MNVFQKSHEDKKCYKSIICKVVNYCKMEFSTILTSFAVLASFSVEVAVADELAKIDSSSNCRRRNHLKESSQELHCHLLARNCRQLSLLIWSISRYHRGLENIWTWFHLVCDSWLGIQSLNFPKINSKVTLGEG